MTNATKPSIEVFASARGGKVRLQTWVGDIVNGAESLCTSIVIDAEQAEKLAVSLLSIARSLPRAGTPADLGCDAL